MIKKGLRFVRGNIKVEVQSAYIERFLNMAWASGLDIWDIRRIDATKITAVVSSKDYEYAAVLSKKCMCNIEVVDKKGLLYSLSPYKGRYSLIIAAILCLAIVYFSTQVLWRISLYGCETISQKELLAQLSDLGLQTGKRLSELDTGDIKLNIMTMRGDIAYITINIKGTWAQVTVKERNVENNILPKPEPCDIISDKTGIIESLQILEGESHLKIGDAVLAGDRLVKGTLLSAQGDVRRLHATANITLRTLRVTKMALSTEIYGLDKTGNEKSYYCLSLGKRGVIGYNIEKSPYSCYYKSKETLFSGVEQGFGLPIYLTRVTYYECTPRQLELSEDSCREVLKQSCKDMTLLALGDGELVRENFEYYFGENQIYGVLSAECLERAGVETKITGD